MKKFIKILPILLIFIGAFTACDLERFPYSAIETGQSFKTIQDAENWNNGVYSFFRARQYGIYTYSQDIQADQLNASVDYGNRNGELHRWSTFLAGSYTIRDAWREYYTAINNINMILDEYSKMELEDAEDIALLNQFKGDAHFARAFYYNELALRWAKAYNPTTASSDLGIPVVLEVDYTIMPARETLENVYKQVLSDISQAKTLLSGQAGNQGSNYFNADVVTALEARVKLYMQDWAGALTAANSLISGGKYPLINTEEDLIDMWTNDMAQEVIFQSYVAQPTELGNANSVYLGYNAGNQRYTPDFIPSQWVIDMYEDEDIRKNAYFQEKPVNLQGQLTDLTLVNKYPGNPELFTTANTNYQHAPKVFRIAEMYLIAAEAAYRSSGDALAPLNVLRVNRGLDALSGVSGDALLEEIKDERFRELAFEGFRLFDLKRWGEGFERRDPQNTDVLTPGSDFYGKSVQANDNKFVWGLPSNDITINPNLTDQQNPGW